MDRDDELTDLTCESESDDESLTDVTNHHEQHVRLGNNLSANDMLIVHGDSTAKCSGVESFFNAASKHLDITSISLRNYIYEELNTNTDFYLKAARYSNDDNVSYLHHVDFVTGIANGTCNDWTDVAHTLLPLALSEWSKRVVVIYTTEILQPVISIQPNDTNVLECNTPVTLALLTNDGTIYRWFSCRRDSSRGDNINLSSEKHAATLSQNLDNVQVETDQRVEIATSLEIMSQQAGTSYSTFVETSNPTVTALPDNCTSNQTTMANKASLGGDNHYVMVTTVPTECDTEQKFALESVNGEDVTKTPTSYRKTRATPANWKNNIRKRLKLAGKEYKDSKGNIRAAKCLKTVNCSKCRYKCSEKIPESVRKDIFVKFYQLSSYGRQKDFICANVSEKKTRTYMDEDMKPVPKKRTKHRSYSFNIEGGNIVVCKAFFSKTLDVGEAYIDHSMSKCSCGTFTGQENRGRGVPPNKTRSEILDVVHKHINSFPAVESHYTHSRTKRKYLPSGLNIAKLYGLYVDHCKNRNSEFVSIGVYRKYFNQHFNFSFHVPKKGQCILCTNYHRNEKEESLTDELEKKFKDHQERKTVSRHQTQLDKDLASSDSTQRVVCFDMEAVLLTPCSRVDEGQYKRKLSCYNLSIHSLADKSAYTYLWDETDGKRGSCEIGTCLYLYLSSVPASVSHAVLYADTGTGQNRNQYVASSLISAVRNIRHLDVVDLKFLEPGHTQINCDSMRSAIEYANKSIHIYEPSQWDTVIGMARRKDPYHVVPLTFRDMIDFKKVNMSTFRNAPINTEGERINWMQIKWLQFRSSHPESVFYKTSFHGEDFKEINLKQKSNSETLDANLPKCYSTKLAISEAKRNDLLSLCSSGVIPERHRAFYESLVSDNSKRDCLYEPDVMESDMDTDDE